ncbi:MAG: DNA/RNA nuclease SfsA, partial [Dehalococcoidales bacterium]|nr:DNA/RNA nuclease SfsA [Dehalococcoidales bacterium]
VFEKALEMRLIPWLDDCRSFRRNARLGDSVIDYLLEGDGEQVYLEVKSAVLRQGHYAMYPDCPSARGRRHIRELTQHVSEGGRAIILFIAALPGVTAFKPNQSGDPELCDLLAEARKAGVELRSIGMYYHPEDSYLYLSSPDLRVV